MDKIDFVVMWVDGSDPKWQQKKTKYAQQETDNFLNCVARYRDWGIFKYWFRGVEQFAPWVNHIYIITDEQVPTFLNTQHPKITIIDHKDIIDAQYLPTFNSSAIEMNFHKIPNLSEHFVFFNDDMFITRPLAKTQVFKKGLPRDNYYETSINPIRNSNGHAMYNNMTIVNDHYDKKAVYKKFPTKFFNLKYKMNNFKTLFMAAYKDFRFIGAPHGPQPFLKSYYKKFCRLEPQSYHKTMIHKTRSSEDVTQYIVRYFQLLDGKFIPVKVDNKSFIIDNTAAAHECAEHLRRQKTTFTCINDDNQIQNFVECQKIIVSAFQDILPDKSEFEK